MDTASVSPVFTSICCTDCVSVPFVRSVKPSKLTDAEVAVVFNLVPV